jgi:hypothetical protein
MMYQLLSGHEPDTTPFRFPPLQSLEPTVPEQLATLIKQMLETDEKKRPESMLIVEQKLQEISSSALSIQPFGLPKPAKQRNKLSPFAQGMVFLGICCMIIGGFIGNGIGTVNANATNQTHATATATAVAATATAQASAMATAQQIASSPNPYSPPGTQALVDPLSQPGAWQEQSDTQWGGQCQFVDGAFQISQNFPNKFYECDTSSIYKNFVIQVNMAITQGDCGGITLRASTDSSKFYKFEACTDGTYYFYRYASRSGSDTKTLNTNYTSPAIGMGVQTDIIAVVANGSTFDLYVNNQKIDSISDSSYSMGSLGLVAHARDQNTTVTYQNAIIWALP